MKPEIVMESIQSITIFLNWLWILHLLKRMKKLDGQGNP